MDEAARRMDARSWLLMELQAQRLRRQHQGRGAARWWVANIGAGRGREMAEIRPLHVEDAETMDKFRMDMRTLRRERGWSMAEVSRRVGRGHALINGLESARNPSPSVASLQQWATALDSRIEFEIDRFWLFAHHDLEMLQRFAASRSWGADTQMRLWLQSALRQWRLKMGLDVAVVAPLLGTAVDGLRDWESLPDPNMQISRIMWGARVTGTRVRLTVFKREDWVFDPTHVVATVKGNE